MRISYIESGYSEKRSYEYQSIEVVGKMGAILDDNEDVDNARIELHDRIKQLVICDADMAIAEFVQRTHAQKAGE